MRPTERREWMLQSTQIRVSQAIFSVGGHVPQLELKPMMHSSMLAKHNEFFKAQDFLMMYPSSTLKSFKFATGECAFDAARKIRVAYERSCLCCPIQTSEALKDGWTMPQRRPLEMNATSARSSRGLTDSSSGQPV